MVPRCPPSERTCSRDGQLPRGRLGRSTPLGGRPRVVGTSIVAIDDPVSVSIDDRAAIDPPAGVGRAGIVRIDDPVAVPIGDLAPVHVTRLFLLTGPLDESDAERLARSLLTDPVVETSSIGRSTNVESKLTAEFSEFLGAVQRGCGDLAMDYVLLRTDMSLDTALTSFLTRRMLRLQ